jgi:hypothetical protein
MTEQEKQRIQSQNESMRPSSVAGVNLDEVRKAWEAAVDVQKSLIDAIHGSKLESKRMRIYSVVAVVLVLLASAANTWLQSRSVDATTEVQEVSRAVASDNASTLRAVRAVSEAVGAKIEADTAMHPIAEEAARQKAIEAQETALTAEVEAADSPADKAAAEEKLAEVRRRQEMVGKVGPAPSSSASGPGGEIDPEDDAALEAAKGSEP